MTNILEQTVNVVNGVAQLQVDTTDIPEGNYTIQAQYNQNDRYKQATDTGTLTLNQGSPWLGLLTPSNWGTYPSGSSGSNQTGPLESISNSAEYTIDTTNQTIQWNTMKYYVYNKTLADLLTYFNNEFSIIVYKTNGDGRFDLGFVNTTTQGYKLGYMCNTNQQRITNEENNIKITTHEYGDGQVKYEQYNEITFKKVGSNLYMYYKIQAVQYVERIIALGNIDMSKYYFYVRGTTNAKVRLTVNQSLIQNYSMQSHEP